jgi:hypothetical protein
MGLLLGGVAVGVTWPTEVRADVAPAPDFVETCTLGRQQRNGETCVECGDSYHGAPDACARQYEPQGYSRRCRSSGASVWDEIWCKPKTAVEPTPEDDQRFAQPPPAEIAAAETPSDQPDEPVVDEIAGETSSAGDVPLQRTEPGGGCGACEVGRSRSGAAAPLLWLLAVVGWLRRRAQR